MDIAGRIKHARIDKRLNQKEFCAGIGISQGSLSELESGKTKPSIETLIAIKVAYNISIDWLALGEEEKISVNGTAPFEFTKYEQDIIQKLRDLDERDREDVFDIITMKHERRQNSIKARECSQLSTSMNGENDMGDNHITA